MLDGDGIAEAEGYADALWSQAGVDAGDVSIGELHRRVLKCNPRFEHMLIHEATLVRLGDVRFAVVRKGTPAPRARWLIGHELGHVVMDRPCGLGYGAQRGDELEAMCDAIGAALVAPRRLVLAARRALGTDDPVALAEELRTTHSIALLRVGEVTGEPVAVVRPRGAIVRGEEWAWPHLDYTTAKAARWPRVRKVQLRDESKRVGLRVA